MKRIREFLESIAFARLKPGGPGAPKQELKWLGPLHGPVERLLSGGPAPTDPLYLSNRTLPQKLKSWSLIGIPCLVLALGIGVTLSDLLDPPEAKPIKEPTAAQIAAKLPIIDKDLQFAPAPDVQVVEIRVDGSRLVGVVKNTTAREIASTQIVIDLTNSVGTQVGTLNGTVERIPPSSSKAFQFPITQRDVAFGIVRLIQSR
jgi:hypothetical protein